MKIKDYTVKEHCYGTLHLPPHFQFQNGFLIQLHSGNRFETYFKSCCLLFPFRILCRIAVFHEVSCSYVFLLQTGLKFIFILLSTLLLLNIEY